MFRPGSQAPMPQHQNGYKNNLRSSVPTAKPLLNKLEDSTSIAATASSGEGSTQQENNNYNERWGDEKSRRKVVEQLLSLSNHLAGSVVDFLVEEMERKISGEDASEVISATRRSMLDDSLLDDTTDYDDDDYDDEEEDSDDDQREEEVEEFPIQQRTRGTTSSLSPPVVRDMRSGRQVGGSLSPPRTKLNGALGSRASPEFATNINNNMLLSRVPNPKEGVSPISNVGSLYGGNRTSGSLLSSESSEREDDEESDGEEDEFWAGLGGSSKDGGPRNSSPQTVPKPIVADEIDGGESGQKDPARSDLEPPSKGGSRPTLSPPRPRMGRGFGRGLGMPGRGEAGRGGRGLQRGGRGAGLPSMRSNSVKNLMKNFSLKEDEPGTNPNEAPNRERSGSPKRGVPRNTSGIRMQRRLEQTTFDRVESSGSTDSNGSSGKRRTRSTRKSNSGGNFGVKRTKSGNLTGLRSTGPRRTRSGRAMKAPALKKQFSFDDNSGLVRSSSDGMYAEDTTRNQLSHDTRKQKRIFRTQNALRKLKRTNIQSLSADSSEAADDDLDDNAFGLDDYKMALPLPFGIKQKAAILFVDISGFTVLSQALKVEQLSKTINGYFQLIVEQVEAFGGDVLKFCGDAIFVSWHATSSSLLKKKASGNLIESPYGEDGIGAEKSVITAAACAAQLIDKASDYEVFDETGQKRVATLNLHCAIGFGEVLGVHVGGLEDRTEYFIIGDPIKQVSEAMDLGKMGEVVASPECLEFLEGNLATKPKVILTKTNKFSNPKLMFVKKDTRKGSKESKMRKRIEKFELPALRSLQKVMSSYAHTVVVENQGLEKGFGSSREAKSKDRFTLEAEIRDVFTIFIQPNISADITEKSVETFQVLQTLHDILILVNKELRRFKGHLRQYTADDKGIVLIANFGLRGSTFPQMVERLAMPFATNVQYNLKAKLNVDCKMGATFGKAYCGVVGNLQRHEYSILGPSINLAARLMGHEDNQGFLVDEEVKRKASNRGYEGLTPVKAKGYRNLVPIFKPMLQHRRTWGSADYFVGRMPEVKQILKFSEDLIEASGSARMVWVSSESGFGKSSLLAFATNQILELCRSKSATHVILCHVCSDADSLQPLSVVGPICLDIIGFIRRSRSETKYDPPKGFDEAVKVAKPGTERLPLHILGACREAHVPDRYICLICHLLLANTWPADIGESSQATEAPEVARYLVRVLLQSTIHIDLLLWSIDDIPHADELSWNVIELLCQYACNVMFLLASRPVTGSDMNISPLFWERLFDQGIKEGNVLSLELSALTKDNLEQLVKKYAAKNQSSLSNEALSSIAKDVLVKSGGMPQLAAQLLDRKFSECSGESKTRSTKSGGPMLRNGKKTSLRSLNLGPDRQGSNSSLSSVSAGSGSFANVGEHMLHRMDILSPETRTHINLSAILGPSFESLDVVHVMERYRGIADVDKEEHSRSVLESLEQAAEGGIIEEDLSGAGMSMSFCAQDDNFVKNENRVTYKFTHADWRKNILKVILDSWKKEMYRLLAESLEERFDVRSKHLDRAIRRLLDPFAGGKKKGKNVSVATVLALKIGAQLTRIGKAKYSLQIYQKALDLWLKPDEDDMVLVMEDDSEDDDLESPKEDELVGEDLEYVSKLYNAMGRCSLLLMDKDKAVSSFDLGIELLSNANCIKDQAIHFPALCGKFYALRLARKLDHEAELDEVYSFVEAAEQHVDVIHHMQALAMEAEIFGRDGDFRKALEACADLRGKYDASVHSQPLVDMYGEDYCAQTLGQSAGWQAGLAKQSKALEACEHVIEILPNLKGTDIFLTLYPVLWVLKDAGQAERGLDLCRKYLILDDENNKENDETLFGPFKKLFRPIHILLDIASMTQSGQQLISTTMVDYVDWAMDTSNGEFDTPFNTFTASVARNADSITAEICLILASQNAAFHAKSGLLSRASAMVRSSMKVTKYMAFAHAQVKGFATDPRYQKL